MPRSWQRNRYVAFCARWSTVLAILQTVIVGSSASAPAQEQAASAQVAKAVGTIKSIKADSITVAVESGGEVTADLTPTTKILRVPPGEKDLKNATAVQAQDLQPGDRVLVRGQISAKSNDHTLAALAVIVMKQADVAAIHQHELDDWQKRGVGGPVTNVDTATNTITISSGGLGTKRNVAVHVASNAVLRRYAPGSVKFEDAKPAPIDQIKVGDQLLARGTRSPDGSEVSAEEVVSGTFRNIAGPIKAVDTAGNTLMVQDVIGKNVVVVNVSPDSQLWKLPPEMAQRFAMRLKGAAGGGSGDQHGSPGQVPSASRVHQPPSGEGSAALGGDSQMKRGAGGNGAPDLQRILSHLPTIKLSDLQKGDVVYILATEDAKSDVMASKLVAGVEPILTAAPNRSATSLLSPWSLGTSAGEGEAAP
jgi:Domain of unknown function (DUF5666)